MARRSFSNRSGSASASNAEELVPLPRGPAAPAPAAPAPAAPPPSDNQKKITMPLTQEKPRFEISFTNNNDHNYLHKKFKKMASTVPRSDEQSSESDSSQHREIPKPQTSTHSSISNHSIAASHPEIEKIRPKDATGTQANHKVHRNECNVVNQDSADCFDDVNIDDKTENVVPDNSNDFGTGGRHVCPYCRISCAKPSVLRKHIRAHTNERPYPCATCGIAFKTKSNLYKHCRSRSHTVRSQGGENAPPINEEDWSESESDTSLPAHSVSESTTDGGEFRAGGERTSEISSPELNKEEATPATSLYPLNKESQPKSIYKPKFHSRLSLCNDDEYSKNKKILSPNPNFLNEHISKIISDNEAIVDVIETPLQKKYGKIKQIAENNQLYTEDNYSNAVSKSETGPLNLSISSGDDIMRRKRCHSESFLDPEQYKHVLNPEGSIIKDLLLKTKMNSGLIQTTGVTYEPFSEHSELQRNIRRKYNGEMISNELSLSPREVVKNLARESFHRSNSIDVTLQESCNSLPKVTLRPCINNLSKPENLIIKPETNDIVAPLPSPGPLLGNTRLVDSRININTKVNPAVKRRLDTKSESLYAKNIDDIISQRKNLYPQTKKMCFENNKTVTLRSLEDLSHSPLRQNSTSLQMFGGEVKIINNSGSTTTLRIEPARQLSPIVIPQPISPSNHSMEGEASNIVQSGLHSGGTIVHNPPTPKEKIISPHPQTPSIMLSIAASVATPNLSVTPIPTPNITHFQFPPLGAITAFNPLTLPPLSPSLSPNGATTILHGGKLIPHVPGIPGPNTPAPFGTNTGLIQYHKNGEYPRSHSSSPKEDAMTNRQSFTQSRERLAQNYDKQGANTNFKISNHVKPVIKDASTNPVHLPIQNEKTSVVPMPRFKIRPMGEKHYTKTGNVKYDDRYNDIPSRHINSEQSRLNTHKSLKPQEKNTSVTLSEHSVVRICEPVEIKNYNFENFITKAEIYNNTGQNNVKNNAQKSPTIQEPLSIIVQTTERSETSYFQKNSNSKNVKEAKSRFLRPSSLPLKPGTFTPKKHHGITPNSNTMPLISPETPRPAKAYGQLYLNGNAYTYLGLKCSTKVFYCTLNRPQPTYVPNQVSLSMYCNWQILLEQAPNPLGLSTSELMSLYDSRNRPQSIVVAAIKQDQILTHSSQWNKQVSENKQKSACESVKQEECKPSAGCSVAGEPGAAKGKEVAGGFESNEEYTYVRGRGRGRYVCLECGIRCKKPSMLKKHIRTHTDVRPYTCKHCSFSFKTKGNLTKHMKSKAHYKKCTELGISPGEGDGEPGEMNPGSGETDDESESDLDDGIEGETESSDTDSYKSRLPEHEAAHCLLSLSGSRPSSAPAPGLLTSARPTTYPYTPAGDEPPHLTRAPSDNSPEPDNEPMDLSRSDVKTATSTEIEAARETSVLASLASNTAKLPVQAQWTNGEPMLHAYLTERALQDTKIKQSQYIHSLTKNTRKQELSKIVEQESSNLIILNNYDPSRSITSIATMHSVEPASVALTYAKTHAADATVAHSPSVMRVSSAELQAIVINASIPSASSADGSKPIGDVNTSTENAKFVASEYLKLARGRIDEVDPGTPSEQQESGKPTFARTPEDAEKRESEPEAKGVKLHGEAFPGPRKVVIGAGGVAFEVDSKGGEFPGGGYAAGRLAEDGRSVCVVCDKSFSKPSQLRLHINIHYMERPYRCGACAVSFRTRGHLQKHERSGSHHNKVSMTSTFGAATSANPRPFRCSDCNIAFRIHGHLAKHLRSKMHVMRLECLSKLPFGTFAEMERAGVSLTDIDTSDCANSLASLQLLAQRLHEKDPTKLEGWDPTMVPPLLPAGHESDDDDDRDPPAPAPAPAPPDYCATDT